jgi:hypothetical protein
MTVPYVIQQTVINKEDTDMVITSEKHIEQVEHFENKDFPVPINKDDKKEFYITYQYLQTLPLLGVVCNYV